MNYRIQYRCHPTGRLQAMECEGEDLNAVAATAAASIKAHHPYAVVVSVTPCSSIPSPPKIPCAVCGQ